MSISGTFRSCRRTSKERCSFFLSSLFLLFSPFKLPSFAAFSIPNSTPPPNTLSLSSKMLSRSTTVSSASSTESKVSFSSFLPNLSLETHSFARSRQSMFRRFFSLRRSASTSTSERESLVVKEEPEVDLFAQIMALNARHGHHSVQVGP